MGRRGVRNDQRNLIAQYAARLMAEDGIEDYALAKRKAARQAGTPDSRQWPTNDEVAAALRAYQQLYHDDVRKDRLKVLLEKAIRAMRELAQFEPHLTGSVLSGSAGKYADINLQLFTDDAKAVELFLIDRRIPYRAAEKRLFSGEQPRAVPVFFVDDAGTEIEIAVLSQMEKRAALKATGSGRPIERARIDTVEDLLSRI